MPESILTKGINEGEEYPAEPATEPILQFGVEFPIFYDYIDIDFDGVNLGDEIEREQERVRNYVRHIMKNRGIDSTLLKNKDDKRLFQYDSLSIKNLILDQSNEGYGIEISTKIWDMDENWSAWCHELYEIFYALSATVDSQMRIPDEYNELHVHISMKSCAWQDSLSGLKRVAKAIIFFERCVDALMPASRIDNRGCKSNHASIFYQTLCPGPDSIPTEAQTSVEAALQAIEEVQNYRDLVALMCSVPRVDLGRTLPWSGGFRWNFQPILEADKGGVPFHEPKDADAKILPGAGRLLRGAIEFRQPPGVHSVEALFGWTYFAGSFVRAAIEPDIRLGTATVQGLRDFVQAGADLCGISYQGEEMFKDLFKDRLENAPSKLTMNVDGYSISLE